MFCPKCRAENPNTAKFCKDCGVELPNFAEVVARTQQHHQIQTGLVGQTLDGKYRIDAKLGSGGMGDVYRATRLLMGDVIAIKTLHSHLAQDPQAAERFRREAITATKLRHKNVVTIYDVGISTAHNVPYILMELAEGYTLRQIINENQSLPLDFAVTVIAQVCAALAEAHQIGIIHRDIKPENIVANQTETGWHIRVLDFGIAKMFNQADSDLTQDGSALGTPQYMSPEQCLGQQLDERSDIYSIGVTLYELLCGKPPFHSIPATAISVHQVGTPPTPLTQLNSNIHHEVEKVISKALSKPKEDRQQSANELSQEFIQAATIAFKTGAKPEKVEEPNVAPISENIVEEKIDIPPIEEVSVDEPTETVEDETPKTSTSEKEESLETENENLTTQSKEEKIKEDGAEVESNLEKKDESDDKDKSIKANVNEEKSVVLELDSREDTSEHTINDAKIEDFSDVIEEVENVLGDILVDSESNKKVIYQETISDDDSTSLQPIPIPDSDDLQGSGNEIQASSNSSVVNTPADGNQNVAIFNEVDSKSNKTLFVFGAIVFIAFFFFISFVGVAIWFFVGSQNSQSASSNSATNEKTNKTKPPKTMVYIAGGEFIMGNENGEEFDRPSHNVTVKPFFLDITEVTNEAYKKFIDETNHKPPNTWKDKEYPKDKGKYPVTGVNWDDANAYAKWAEKRLPTEEEWEFAAKGTENRIYPWGNEWKENYANAKNTNRGMVEVGTTEGKTSSGLYDMVGNAWEWTSTDAKPYPNGKDFYTQSQNPKIIRGGYWGSAKLEATTTFRGAWGARKEKSYDNTGFRCAKDIPQH